MNAQAQTQADTQTKQNNSVVVGGRNYTHVSTDRRFLARVLATDLVHPQLVNMVALLEAGEETERTMRCTKDLYSPFAEIQLEPIPEVDWTQVEVDTPIWVRDKTTDAWDKRHFAEFDQTRKKVRAWNNGWTSFTAHPVSHTSWNYATLVDPNTQPQ